MQETKEVEVKKTSLQQQQAGRQTARYNTVALAMPAEEQKGILGLNEK